MRRSALKLKPCPASTYEPGTVLCSKGLITRGYFGSRKDDAPRPALKHAGWVGRRMECGPQGKWCCRIRAGL